ncbi:Putative S-adenosyl-L-methionine-dependent methyltransferase superfamily [Colletotrichum destructivum]|uniref:S-adenosyl-L-methionine-dependent methyltransferase superfamily n=1 Tax=Colletotrichum destructivum TaxID=34406 RepID=A0AAX4J4E7_9PEZI|nr:Putative S-adenosyl-L-methionine-dependent methyltransferase superfamily [Colletotrichum destructivum]
MDTSFKQRVRRRYTWNFGIESLTNLPTNGFENESTQKAHSISMQRLSYGIHGPSRRCKTRPPYSPEVVPMRHQEILNVVDLFNKVICLARNETRERPNQKASRVLDIRTGTGIWAISLAEADHSSRVTGIDTVLMYPTAYVPNASFLRVDKIEGP